MNEGWVLLKKIQKSINRCHSDDTVDEIKLSIYKIRVIILKACLSLIQRENVNLNERKKINTLFQLQLLFQ